MALVSKVISFHLALFGGSSYNTLGTRLTMFRDKDKTIFAFMKVLTKITYRNLIENG